MELDVEFTADGVPILMHDDTVDRTTNGSGPLSKILFSELRKLDAAAKHRLRFESSIIYTPDLYNTKLQSKTTGGMFLLVV